jgi:hypothetical protein
MKALSASERYDMQRSRRILMISLIFLEKALEQ